MWLYVGIYLAGMVLGFFVSAFSKGRNGLWSDDHDKFIPVLMTFFWPVAIFLFLLLVIVAGVMESPRLFFWLMNKACSGIEKTKNYKWSRKRIPPPRPVIQQQYRQPGPHPCIACGTPTSVDQSDMECVESEKAQYVRLDI